MQLYNEFIKFCNSLLGYINTQYLVYGALISLAFFLVWTAFSTITSSIRRFYLRCNRLEWYLRKNKVGYENINSIDKYCMKISANFFYGWNKFKKSEGKRPSDFLTKREVLDAEVSDGMLNHGKTLMKTYIGVTTVLLFILNLAYLGKDEVFTFSILVESMFLPFVYYVIMILMYFVSNLIKQQTYMIASAHFYDLVDRLDQCFEKPRFEFTDINNETLAQKNEEPVLKESETLPIVDSQEIEKVESEQNETKDSNQIVDESIIEDSQSEQVEESKEIENFTQPEKQEFINAENSEVNLVEEESVETPVEEVAKEESVQEVEQPVVEPFEQEQPVVKKDWENEENLEYYDVFKKKNINVDKYINEIPSDEEYTTPFIDVDRGFVPTEDMEIEEQSTVENVDSQQKDQVENEKFSLADFEIDQVKDVEKVELENESEVESNEAIEDKIESDVDEVDENQDEADIDEIEDENIEIDDDNLSLFDFGNNNQDEEESNEEIEVSNNEEESELNEENSNDIQTEEFDFFDSEKEEAEKVDIFAETSANEEPINNEPTVDLKSQIEQNLSESSKEIDSKLEDNIEANLDLSALVGEFKQNYQDEDDQKENVISETAITEKNKSETVAETKADDTDINAKKIYAKINDLEDLIHSAISKGSSEETKIKTKKSKKGKTKMTENENTKKTRGRPKMQAIDENLVINSEEEFEEILSRAEKLMRKSESGLSASQSKRIEKELKIMMDAMNKYKEG